MRYATLEFPTKKRRILSLAHHAICGKLPILFRIKHTHIGNFTHCQVGVQTHNIGGALRDTGDSLRQATHTLID